MFQTDRATWERAWAKREKMILKLKWFPVTEIWHLRSNRAQGLRGKERKCSLGQQPRGGHVARPGSQASPHWEWRGIVRFKSSVQLQALIIFAAGQSPALCPDLQQVKLWAYVRRPCSATQNGPQRRRTGLRPGLLSTWGLCSILLIWSRFYLRMWMLEEIK